MRTLLKDQHSGQWRWLTGGEAAVWEALEQGSTLARIRRRAAPLGMNESLPGLIRTWIEAGLIQDPSIRRIDGNLAGEATTEENARTWMAAQGYPFEAEWNLAERLVSAREAMDRLDFLRESGVFQIRFVNGPSPMPPAAQRVQIAARAQGFSVVSD